jgi:hypothetical protein
MDETMIRQYIMQTFAGVEAVDGSGGSFFFFGPDHRFPFATLTTSDEYDQASNLSRPSVFRLNVGVSKQTFQSLFGPNSAPSGEAGTEGGYDFAALDRIMPHPVYGKMYWICVLNPSAATFQKVQELLAEAYDMAVRKRARTFSENKA